MMCVGGDVIEGMVNSKERSRSSVNVCSANFERASRAIIVSYIVIEDGWMET